MVTAQATAILGRGAGDHVGVARTWNLRTAGAGTQELPGGTLLWVHLGLLPGVLKDVGAGSTCGLEAPAAVGVRTIPPGDSDNDSQRAGRNSLFLFPAASLLPHPSPPLAGAAGKGETPLAVSRLALRQSVEGRLCS